MLGVGQGWETVGTGAGGHRNGLSWRWWRALGVLVGLYSVGSLGRPELGLGTQTRPNGD